MNSAVLIFGVTLVVSCSNALSPPKPDGPPADPTDITPSKLTKLSLPRCGPICRMYCPNGFVRDGRNCPICKCKPGKCPRFTTLLNCRSCKYGRSYYTDRNGCRRCKCKTKPVCPVYIKDPCDGKTCPNGFLKNSRGCPTCNCKASLNICPIKRCLRRCRSGYRLDSRGCKTCMCKGEKRTCKHNGKTYRHGQRYKKDCNTCYCFNGRSLCTKRGCNTVPDFPIRDVQ